MTLNEAWALGLLLALILLVGCFLFLRGCADECPAFSVATCPDHAFPPTPPRPAALDPKDCPECGNEAEVRPLGAAGDGIYWVECSNGAGCCLQGPTRLTRSEALAAWERIEVRR